MSSPEENPAPSHGVAWNIPISTAAVEKSEELIKKKKDMSSESLPPTSMGLIKCPLYCRSNCAIQHHPLLVAVLNCVDTSHFELMEMKLGILRNVINKYKQSIVTPSCKGEEGSNHKWSPNDPIPDVFEEYRAPLLHWVCTLGRVGAAIWLIGHDICSPSVRSVRHKGETGLHRALLCLQETCPIEPSRKFVQLLSVMEPALAIADDNGNTPLHDCCEMLRICLPRVEYYRECLHYMLYELNNESSTCYPNVSCILNMKNIEGNTVLHLLSEGDKHLAEVKPLVQLGADYTIENNSGFTPYEIALKNNCSLLARFYETWEGTDPQPTSFVLHGSVKPLDKQGGTNKHAAELSSVSEETSERSISPSEDNFSGTNDTNSTDQAHSEVMTSEHTLADDDKNINTDVEEKGYFEPLPKKLKDGTETNKLPSWIDIQLNQQSFLTKSPGEMVQTLLTKGLDSCGDSDIAASPSVPVLFTSEEDSGAQNYFERVVNEQTMTHKICSPKSFIELVAELDTSNPENTARLEEALQEMHPATVTRCLVTMKESGTSCQPVIDFILRSRNKALNNLKLTNKCIGRLHQNIQDKQTKQDQIVHTLMKTFKNLSSLNKEELKHMKEFNEVNRDAEAAKLNNDCIQERLTNCEASIKVLKRLYAEKQ